jgi:TRAP-type C4-dicarboxylate transport system permease small subunit
MGPGAFFIDSLPYRLADVWVTAYWCLVALSILQLGWNAQKLARGRWQKPYPACNLLFRAVGLIPVVLLLNAKDHATILLKNPALDQARLGASLNNINRVIHLSLTLICALVCLGLIWETVQLILNVYRKRAAAMQQPQSQERKL